MAKLLIDDKFLNLLKSLDSKLKLLIKMNPKKPNKLPNDTSKGGGYLF
jgi:hypothetical protein